MNINPINMYNQNFQARIKMNPANLKTIAKTSLGVSAIAALTASAANNPNAVVDSSFAIGPLASLTSTGATQMLETFSSDKTVVDENNDKKIPD